jgi:hypothetical protein
MIGTAKLSTDTVILDNQNQLPQQSNYIGNKIKPHPNKNKIIQNKDSKFNNFGLNKLPHRTLSEMSYESVSSSSSQLLIGTEGIWFYSNGLGTYYQITDTHGLKVHYMGTICQDVQSNKNSGGKCDINLNPGCYIFRVGGAFDPDIEQVSWNFCGTKGGAQTQLNFCVDDNLKCKATSAQTAEEICADTVTDASSTTLSMSGTFHLGGMKVAELTTKDTLAIRNALMKEFNDAYDSPNKKGVVEISKLSWTHANPQISEISSSRRLDYSGFTTSVSFEINLLAERFGVKTTDEVGLNKLHHHMNDYLSRSMSIGIFTKKVAEAARSVQSTNLLSVNFARLGTMKVVHENTVKNKISLFANIVIIGSAIIGIAFSYTTYRSMVQSENDYDIVMNESQHEIANVESTAANQMK